MMTAAQKLTRSQQQAMDLIRAEGTVNSRRLAGEFGFRPQDAGRTLESLRRAGLVYFTPGNGQTTFSGFREVGT